jgi:hypothetical protein
MAKCTIEAAGVGVLASKERFAEITMGKSYFQLNSNNSKGLSSRLEPK